MVYNYNEQMSRTRKIIGSKIFILALLVLFVLIGYAVYREKNKQVRIVQNISALEEEIGKLEKKNTELVQLIEYLKSDDFIDREAREKLNMQQPGERVVLMPVGDIGGVLVNGVNSEEKEGNWYLWLEYFFGE